MALVALTLLAAPTLLPAVTSTDSVESVFGGNGHNASFDGRVYMVRDAQGWGVRILRPEATTYLPSGLPNAQGPMWSARTTFLSTVPPGDLVENALALCEPDSARAPFACDDDGNTNAGGPYDCYDFWVLDSDAVTPKESGGAVLRRRHMTLWVADPKTATARVHKVDLSATLEPLTPNLRGIEPTITADGKLLVWQGHPDNDGDIDIIVYSVNDDACAAGGWSTPKSISAMSSDSAVVGTYRLAEKSLRSAGGEIFSASDLFRGAYPWLMPNGDALVFQATNMPCRAEEDPPGCGPRRSSFSVVGYPTNWGVAVVDGDVNPSTTDVVRLFFSSPGPTTFTQIPVTEGLDVWPFFGTNTSNYAELIFDDGLDGNYAGFWHFNENVTHDGELDLEHTPDVSGYFNTGTLLGGASVATDNQGLLGRALELNGLGQRMRVAHSITLNPVNGITVDFWINPSADPECDGNNNYRFLLGKGDITTGSYSVVLEESLALHFRFNVDGTQHSLVTPTVPLNQWTHVSCEYDGPSGDAGCWVDDTQVVTEALPTGTVTATTEDLLIVARGIGRACPDGDGAFQGFVDELSVSRFARHLGEPPITEEVDAGVPGGGGDGGAGVGSDAGTGSGNGGGCGCRSSHSQGASTIPLAFIALAMVRTAGRRRRRRLAARDR